MNSFFVLFVGMCNIFRGHSAHEVYRRKAEAFKLQLECLIPNFCQKEVCAASLKVCLFLTTALRRRQMWQLR